MRDYQRPDREENECMYIGRCVTWHRWRVVLHKDLVAGCWVFVREGSLKKISACGRLVALCAVWLENLAGDRLNEREQD